MKKHIFYCKIFFVFFVSIFIGHSYNNSFTLLNSGEYIIAKNGSYTNVKNNNSITENQGTLIHNPLEAAYFFAIFNNPINIENFINSVLFPSGQNIKAEKANDYENTPGKPLIWKCSNENQNYFELVLSVSENFASNIVAYYSRINDRKSTNAPIKYFTFYLNNNSSSSEIGKNIGIFSSSLDLQKSSIKKIPNVLDEIIINVPQIAAKINNENVLIKIGNSQYPVNKEGLEWLKLLTIAYFQNPIKGKYLIPHINLSTNIENILQSLNNNNDHHDWDLSLYPSEYMLVTDIHKATTIDLADTLKDSFSEILQKTNVEDIRSVNEVSNQCKNISSNISTINDVINKLDIGADEIKNASDAIHNSSSLIDTKVNEISNLHETIEKIAHENTNIQNLINTINGSLHSITTITNPDQSTSQTMIPINQQVSSLQNMTLGISDSIAKLHTLLTTFPSTSSMNSQFTNVIAKIDTLSNALASISSSNLTQLSTVIQEMNKLTTKFSQTISSLAISDFNNMITKLNSIGSEIGSFPAKFSALESISSITQTQTNEINNTINNLQTNITNVSQELSSLSTKIDEIKTTSGDGEQADTNAIISHINNNLPNKEETYQKLDEIINLLNGGSSSKPDPETPETPETNGNYYEIKPYLEKLPFKTYDTEKECASILNKNPQLIFYITAKILSLDAMISFGDNYSEMSVMTSNRNHHGDDKIRSYVRRNRALVFYNTFKDEFLHIYNNIRTHLKYGNAIHDMYNRLFKMMIESTLKDQNSWKMTNAATYCTEFWVDKLPFKDLSSQKTYISESWGTTETAKNNIANRSFDTISTTTNIQTVTDASATNLAILEEQFKNLTKNSQYFLFYLMARYICMDIDDWTTINASQNKTYSEFKTMELGGAHITITNNYYTPAKKKVLLNRIYLLKKAFPYNGFHDGQINEYNLYVFKHWINEYLSSSNNADVNSFMKYNSVLNMTLSNYWTKTYHENLDNIKP